MGGGVWLLAHIIISNVCFTTGASPWRGCHGERHDRWSDLADAHPVPGLRSGNAVHDDAAVEAMESPLIAHDVVLSFGPEDAVHVEVWLVQDDLVQPLLQVLHVVPAVPNEQRPRAATLSLLGRGTNATFFDIA